MPKGTCKRGLTKGAREGPLDEGAETPQLRSVQQEDARLLLVTRHLRQDRAGLQGLLPARRGQRPC